MAETTVDRVPPHNAEAEAGVVGSILLDTSTNNDTRVLDLCLSKGLTGESFYDPRMRLLFQSMVEMNRASMPIDTVTLPEYLRSKDRFDAVGGMTSIMSLIDNTPTTAHAEYWSDIVRQKALLRTLIQKARTAEARCFDASEHVNADVLRGEIEREFLDVGGVETQRISWKTAIINSHQQIDRLFESGRGALNGLPTGYQHLDARLMGLKPGDMIVLAARPSMGKTSLALNIAECVATGTDINGYAMKGEHGRPHPVLVFSLEMSTEALSYRMLCGRALVNAWRLQRGLLNDDERAEATSNLFSARAVLEKAPIFIDDTSALDVTDMRARARRMKRMHNIELIVIDYLQLCNCREFANQGRQLETSRISSQIKAMAKELQVPVIVLSQLSRANEQRSDKEEVPKLSDLRDSGAIEQDADVVMLLRRPSRTRGAKYHDFELLAIVDIAKFRNGQTGEVDFNFYGDYTRFGDRRQGKEGRETPDGEPIAGMSDSSEDGKDDA